MIFNGLRGIVNISLFLFFAKNRNPLCSEKVFFFEISLNHSLGRCVHSVKTPATPFPAISAPHPFHIHSRQSFLLSYCTKINQYLIVKSKCTLFLQSNNQYLARSHRKQATYCLLLIRQPLDQLRDAFFPRPGCYLFNVFLA